MVLRMSVPDRTLTLMTYTLLAEPARHTCWDSEDFDGQMQDGCAGCDQAAAHPCRFCGYGHVFTTHNSDPHFTGGDPLTDEASDAWVDGPHVYSGPMVPVMDLNADLGEGGEHDEALLAVVTSANVSCGVHAGSLDLTAATVAAARERGVRVGAHPSYPDRENFGRVSMADMPTGALGEVIVKQLRDFKRVAGVPDYVKPHGALYSDIMGDSLIAAVVLTACEQAFRGVKMPLMVPAGSVLAEMAEDAGVPVIFEAFPDRAYTAFGALVPRSNAGAVITDPEVVAARAVQIATHGVIKDFMGRDLGVRARSLCLHGDSAGADTGRVVRDALVAAGVEVAV